MWPRSRTSRAALPLLPLAPVLVIVFGLAIALIMAAGGVRELKRVGERAAAVRAELLAASLAARLRVTGSEDRREVVTGAGRSAYAEALLIDLDGDVLVNAAVKAPDRDELLTCLIAGTGTLRTAVGRTRYAVHSLGPPLESLSVLVMVPAPETPPEARGLVVAVGALAAVLVGVAALVAAFFANDVRSDVKYVRLRIGSMAESEAEPIGAPIPVRALDQVGVLTSAFNSLVRRFVAAERSYRQDLSLFSALERERSAFLAAVSHELRTPLNALLGFTDVLISEVDGPLDPSTKEDLAVVRASASHLQLLINDILELSMLESGQLQLTRKIVDMTVIAEEVVREARPMAVAKGLTLSVSGSRHAYVDGDSRRLRQILGNLVGNAIKFTSRGTVNVRVETSLSQVLVHTEDTGPGIAPDERAIIFEEYGQAGDTTLRRKGTGLGLAIARKLVQLHGGEIELETELNRGSRFTVRLGASRVSP